MKKFFEVLAQVAALLAVCVMFAAMAGCASVETVRHDDPAAKGLSDATINLEGLSVIDPDLGSVTFNQEKEWVQVVADNRGFYIFCFPIMTGAKDGGVAFFTDTVSTKVVTEMALAECGRQGFTDVRSISFNRSSSVIKLIENFSIPHVFYFKSAELVAIATPKKTEPAAGPAVAAEKAFKQRSLTTDRRWLKINSNPSAPPPLLPTRN